MIKAVAEVMNINVSDATEISLSEFLNWYGFRKDQLRIEQERIKKFKRC